MFLYFSYNGPRYIYFLSKESRNFALLQSLVLEEERMNDWKMIAISGILYGRHQAVPFTYKFICKLPNNSGR
jgi:hypothetical protein